MGAHQTQVSGCQPRCTRAQREAGPSFPPESRDSGRLEACVTPPPQTSHTTHHLGEQQSGI